MTDVREGVVTRHYLKCPFCPGSMDLDRRVCSKCGARPVAVLWEHDSPELAMVAREHEPPPRCVYEGCTAEGTEVISTVVLIPTYGGGGGQEKIDADLCLCRTHADVVRGDAIRGVTMGWEREIAR